MHRTNSSLQKMSNEVVDVEIPMFCCCKGKYIGRVPKTMNLEGHCPAVEIQDRGRKDGNALAKERVSSDERMATCD